MSPERMQRSFIALFGDKQLGEVARGAFSKEEMSAIAKRCQLMKRTPKSQFEKEEKNVRWSSRTEKTWGPWWTTIPPRCLQWQAVPAQSWKTWCSTPSGASWRTYALSIGPGLRSQGNSREIWLGQTAMHGKLIRPEWRPTWGHQGRFGSLSTS